MKTRILLIFVIFGEFFCGAKRVIETPTQKLDDVITEAFRARDLNHDSILTSAEIRSYYEAHPDKMTSKGIDFIDRNFSHSNETIDEYRHAIKTWLAENGTAAILVDFEFGTNSTKKGHHSKKANNSTTIIQKFIKP